MDSLDSFPAHNRRIFYNLLGYIRLLRLSVCCRSLRNNIQNDMLLWQKLYRKNSPSDTYYAKGTDFVLWCARTDVNNPCTSEKRTDLLKNVD
jgi:hypothetical protein